MISAEGLLILTIVLILILLLYQKISFRLAFSESFTVEIEYFPIKLILYNFRKSRKAKRKLRKKLKRLLSLSMPITKSALRFFRRADVKLYDLKLLDSDDAEPHIHSVKLTLINAFETYLHSFFYSLFRTSTVYSGGIENSKKSIISFDFEVTARFYNLIFAFFIFIFFLIKKKGGNQKIVG